MKTKDFIRQVIKNEELASKMRNSSSTEEIYQIAKDNGVTDDQKQFFQAMKQFRDEMSKLDSDDLGTLTDSASTTEIVSAVSTWTGAAAAAASAAV